MAAGAGSRHVFGRSVSYAGEEGVPVYSRYAHVRLVDTAAFRCYLVAVVFDRSSRDPRRQYCPVQC